MPDRFASRRPGMTLVELLVIVAIIGLLAVTVLPSLSNTTEGRRTRETTRMITSFIVQSQSKALGRPAGAGFGLIKTGTLPESPTIDLVPAIIPEAYRGDTPSAGVILKVPAGGATGTTMDLEFTPKNSNSSFVTVSCTTGDLIRFDDRGAWFSLIGTGTPTSCTLRSTAAVDALAGQTAANTPWPAVSSSHTFEILRGPQRSGAVMSLGDGRCIDTFWSFAGTQRLNLPAATPEIYVVFDASGGVRQIVTGQNRFSPDGPVLLLVGRIDRAGGGWAPLESADDSVGANWQYADSSWIAIDLVSGVCRAAACDAAAAAQSPPSGTSDPVAWRLAQSQNTIRSVLFTGTR